jgi:hypothetical protein
MGSESESCGGTCGPAGRCGTALEGCCGTTGPNGVFLATPVEREGIEVEVGVETGSGNAALEAAVLKAVVEAAAAAAAAASRSLIFLSGQKHAVREAYHYR